MPSKKKSPRGKRKEIADAYMVDYVKKEQRTFSSLSFNEMDGLIFSWISYLLVPDKFDSKKANNELTLNELLSDEETLKHTQMMFNPEKSVELFKTISISNRYKDVIVTDFVEKENSSIQLQYGSMAFHIPSSDIIVMAFKGTNGTMNGWYEDLDMCFKFPIASQLEAKTQTDILMEKYPFNKFIIAGHSKGGNIAIYSAATQSIQNQERIIDVYSFDGPGFLGDFSKQQSYKNIKKKIHKFIPQCSVFGLLLEYSKHYKVIESNGFFVYQHSPFTWLVDLRKNKLKSYPELAKPAKLFSKTIDGWMNDFTIEERERAISLLFNTILENDIKTSKELKKRFPIILKSFSKLDEKDKKFTKNVLKSLAASGFGSLGGQIKISFSPKRAKKKSNHKDSTNSSR